MIALALLLAAQPMPDLDAAIANYAALAVDADRGADPQWVSQAANNVCQIAYRYTMLADNRDAADRVIAYRGPRADRLRLTCSVYFTLRSR